MSFDWDILFNSVSIKEAIAEFQIRASDSAYVKELTLFSVDPSFFDSLDYTTLPSLSIEVKTKITDTWVSQGFFFIESPTLALDSKSKISRGVWGRSKTAKAGSPFAEKITQTWITNTTLQAIVNEMADLVGLTVLFEIDDYPIYANTYSADLKYPIEVINELCQFAGAFISCDTSGNLIIKKRIFHTLAEDYTVTDAEIVSLSEKTKYPDFGNRIKVSSFSSNTGYSVVLKPLYDNYCLPADGMSELTLLAFISLDGEPAEDNLLISWTAEDGVTLAKTQSSTQSYLLDKQSHKATGYNTVEVDFPIKDVIGIWAYNDTQKTLNYWNSDLLNCSFDGKEITVHNSFKYCDQTLIISYITSGVAVNTATAGTIVASPSITAELDGASGELEIIIGNICECGLDLNVRKIPDSEICLGNKGYILAWAEVSNEPGDDLIATFELDGCGSLSSTKKTLGDVIIEDEVGSAFNTIEGVTQVKSEIIPSNSATPKIYLITDTGKTNDLYSSHYGKLIDLNTLLDNGTEVWIDYTAAGAGAVTWLTRGLSSSDDGCSAEVTVKIADGSETGSEDSVTITMTDCTEYTEDETDNEYSSDDDPVSVSNSTSNGGDEDEDFVPSEDDPDLPSGGVSLTSCDTMMLSIWSNIENATQETKDQVRFGVPSEEDCPPEGTDFACECSEICEREIINRGNTFEYDTTIHDQALEYGEEGSPEYNEAYNTIRIDNLATCEEKCSDTRDSVCGGLCNIVSGPDSLSPGETAEYICGDGTVGLITMPEDACGTVSFTLGCCSFEVRSTEGHWVLQDSWSQLGCSGDDSYCYLYSLTSCYCSYIIIDGGTRYVGENSVFYTKNGCSDCDCQPEPREGSCIVYNCFNAPDNPVLGCNTKNYVIKPRNESTYTWECE